MCVTLSRYIKIGENLLNEVPVEKSILVDFDQFITLVNKWKAKWVHEGYSWLKKKNTKTTPVSAVLPPSDLLFLLRGHLQGSVRVRSVWRFQLIDGTITGRSTCRSLTIFGCSGSCLDLIVLNARTMKRQKEEVEEFQKREKKGQWLL